MCIAIPGQIKKISKNSALVSWGKIKKNVGTDLVKNLKINDWVLVQNNLIIKKLNNSEVKKFFKLIP
jgi:hydrogenase expression/formation protein HypC